MSETTMIDETTALAEKAVLGSSMISTVAHERCQAILNATDFYNPTHQHIWDALAYLAAQGDAANPVRPDMTLVVGRLAEKGTLAAVGGAPYLRSLVDGVITHENAQYYAKQVKNASRQRRMVAVGTRLMQGGGSALASEDRDSLVTESMQELEDLNAATGAQDPAAILGDALSETMEALEGSGAGGITTGLPDLDEVLGGLTGGQVVVVGARPGTGKTVIAQQFATHVARDLKRPAMLFTMEMSRMEMMARVIAAEARVNSRHVNLAKPALTEEDWTRIAHALPTILEMPLYVCDEPSITPARVNALVGAFKRKHPDLSVVVIDYLGLMEGDSRMKDRQETISAISREIKKIAKRHDVAIVLLSQLNRNSTQRSDGRPVVSDLRDSGAVEQDADKIILLHREDQYEPESPRAGEMDLILAKNRNGATGEVTVAAQMHYYRLASLAPDTSSYGNSAPF